MTVELADDVSYDLGRDDWELMNLVPADTGLPLTVWVGPRGGARHDVRVKVCTVPGDRMVADEVGVGAGGPPPAAPALPLPVWVGPPGGARHDVRVKVCTVPGDRMVADEVAVVAVRPRP